MALIDTRRDQMFPFLTRAQIDTARRFASGDERSFEAGELVFDVGDANRSTWLVLDGAIEVVQRDGRGVETPIATERAGQFSGEVSQLSGKPSLVAGRAGVQGAKAVPYDAAHLRALVIGSADVGEIVMSAFILRRVGLIEATGAGSILIGRLDDRELVRLQGFPHQQQLSHHRARRVSGGGARARGTVRRAGRGSPPHVLPQRHGAEAAGRRRNRRLPWHHARPRS